MTKNRIVVSTSIFLLLVLTVVVVMERFGIQAEEPQTGREDIPIEEIAKQKAPEEWLKETLILSDGAEASEREDELLFVLESLSVGYDLLTVPEVEANGLPDLFDYQTVILNTTQTELLAGTDALNELIWWVEDGGRLWIALPDLDSAVFQAYPEVFGISKMEPGTETVATIEMVTDFMIGSKGFTYHLEDFQTYGLDVSLTEEALIHAWQSDTQTPLVWEKEFGKGRVVVNNVDIGGKSSRGLYAAQYSLLEDVFAYPVINTSVFFLDDFPAPFPDGWNEHITEYHDVDIESFFANVWLPDMMEIEETYDIPFTSVVIVTYKDDTSPPYDESVDRETFEFYGNLMNTTGGEIGFHGYNHQPLVLDGFEFSEDLGYNTWSSTDDMAAALKAMISTTSWVFPGTQPSVYVPPSNILSEEARELMANEVEEIKTIASLYTVTGSEYEQEFEVAEDGIVHLPRTVSGLDLFQYDRWMALNELNFHFANSHFFHPDDLMDVERGAEKGWTYLKGTFEEYLQWLEEAAPGLRKQRASEAAKSIQRFDAATFERTVYEEDGLYEISIDNFYDELYVLVRIREDTVESVEGGTLTPLTTELYLLKAEEDTVTIHLDR